MGRRVFGDWLQDHQRLDILYSLAAVDGGAGVTCVTAAADNPAIETGAWGEGKLNSVGTAGPTKNSCLSR
jgi:hypothetical protein